MYLNIGYAFLFYSRGREKSVFYLRNGISFL